MTKVDLLTPLRPDKDLHPQFLTLIRSELYEPARGMLREVYADFDDPDGNFVEQFSRSGSVARPNSRMKLDSGGRSENRGFYIRIQRIER